MSERLRRIIPTYIALATEKDVREDKFKILLNFILFA